MLSNSVTFFPKEMQAIHIAGMFARIAEVCNASQDENGNDWPFVGSTYDVAAEGACDALAVAFGSTAAEAVWKRHVETGESIQACMTEHFSL